MLAQLFAVIAPVFFTALVGFTWIKSGRGFDTDKLTPLITSVGTPCLVVSTLLKADISLDHLARMAGAGALAHLAALVVGFVLLKAIGRSVSAFLPALSFPNTGNMGLPLCLFAFGEQGLALAIGYFVVSAVGQFTLGYAIAAGTVDIRRLARTPILWAVAVALVLMAVDADIPLWAANTIQLIGQFTIPLMLMTLGASLARLSVRRLGLPAALSVLRLVGGAALGLAIASIMGLEGAARGVVVLQTAMPVAVFNYLFAQLHDNQPEEVAGLVVISTALSVVTLPLLLAYLL
ncbi:AEC family transporter [Marivibrio halodurans]|uniref:AEC family transporter n=1 Tax=Marivibrio halodurans TaxID=2039722 RepID=A0A8J7V3V2_9PROT|nr:AEC family transporter [Marivibrio halodurans]MBP5858780.1 AEC family transporter [Marivibrio halodurans]